MWVGEQLLLLDNLLTYYRVILLFLHKIKLCYLNLNKSLWLKMYGSSPQITKKLSYFKLFAVICHKTTYECLLFENLLKRDPTIL